MDINNLIQTIVFMNIKDISKMSYRELFPIVLFCLLHSYKDSILEFIKSFLKRDSYKSQLINEITFSYDKEGNMIRNYTGCITAILWYYRKNTEAVKSSTIVKEYRLRAFAEKDKDGDFLHDIYIPNINTTVKLDTDIYLEFIHSSKVINTGKDTTNKETMITLILKSKTLDSLSLRKWLDDVIASYNLWDKGDTRLKLYTSDNSSNNLLIFCSYVLKSTKTFDNLFFEQKEIIINRLRQYEDNDRYKRLGIPHTLGFLFHGEPGCGKTSCIKAIANHLQRSVVTINLKHVKDVRELTVLFLSDYLSGGWKEPKNKRIYVFEEIDCCVDENVNPFLDRSLKIKKEIKEDDKLDKLATALLKDEKTVLKTPPKITTGDVLELLDGICETDDRIIIFTTNHPEKIDKAFLRPGRIDLSIEFKKLRKVDINNLYKLWFNKSISDKVLNKIKDYSLSQAEFGKLCFENNAEKVLEKLVNGN